MPGLMVLKPVAGLAWKAVRRLLARTEAGHTQSLTIGAIIMNPNPPETPAVPGVPTSRRSLAYSALLGLAQDLLTARFVIARSADQLTTEQMLEVLDEVSEVLDNAPSGFRPQIVTQRSED